MSQTYRSALLCQKEVSRPWCSGESQRHPVWNAGQAYTSVEISGRFTTFTDKQLYTVYCAHAHDPKWPLNTLHVCRIHPISGQSPMLKYIFEEQQKQFINVYDSL